MAEGVTTNTDSVANAKGSSDGIRFLSVVASGSSLQWGLYSNVAHPLDGDWFVIKRIQQSTNGDKFQVTMSKCETNKGKFDSMFIYYVFLFYNSVFVIMWYYLYNMST